MAEQYKDGASVAALNFTPGVKRDGTQFDGNFATDARWCRWRLGRPKKMGGYRAIDDNFAGPIRAVLCYGLNSIVRTFLFSGSGVQYLDLDIDCNGSITTTSTISGFTPDDNFTWQLATLFDSAGGGDTLLIAHASAYLNTNGIADQTNYPFYYGSILNFPANGLNNVSPEEVSGGICVLQPFLFIYGNNGLIKNSDNNDVTNFASGNANEVNVSGSKVVKGLPVRGGGQSPAGIFWTLEDVIRVNFVGGAPKFQYDTVTSKSSILSPNAVVEHDGVFYWPGVDRFLMYNGVVKEVKNQFNADFFFENLNINQRCKIWGTTVPRWGEIWWFFPRGQAEEPNWAVVYNVREECWYDTPITRSAGYFSQVLRFPIWANSLTNSEAISNQDFSGTTPVRRSDPAPVPPGVEAGDYVLWQHEFGVNQIIYGQELAIDSYFDTPYLGFVNGEPMQGQSAPVGMDNWTRTVRVEPDFVQSGPMTATFTTKKFANSDQVTELTKTFTPGTETLEVRVQGRLNRIRYRSNVAGGNYHMGRVLVTPEVGDPRAS